ncbi:MAG: aromatic ring-hydroxylating dioxygenase subunit alpha [Elainellaceae cyanobacterium]
MIQLDTLIPPSDRIAEPATATNATDTTDGLPQASASPPISPVPAAGLPRSAYTSRKYLQRERQTVFKNYWVFVGCASQVANPGDMLPVDVAGMPLVLVRDRAGQLRAFHNICSHRGLQLVSKPCQNQGRIRCPYHSWAYQLDGTLKSTPHFGGYYQDTYDGFDRASEDLKAVRCDVWHDWVFVNLSGDAPPLADYLKPVSDRWTDYDLSLLRRGPEISFECAANWKLAVENFSESYHLPWVHPALNGCSRMEDHFGFDVGPDHVGQGSRLYQIGSLEGRTLPLFSGLEACDRTTVAEYVSIFPNLMLGVHPDYFIAFTVNPIAPDRSLERMIFYFVGDAAMAPELEALRHIPVHLWKITNEEDIIMIERMQTGRQSPAFDGGCFSPALEQTVRQFQHLVHQAVNR